jgi:antitoxin HigA-1
MTQRLPLITPGEILLEEFMRPLGISQNKLAAALGVNTGRINEIVRAHRGISADTALRLARYFGTTAEFWLNLQIRYDLACATKEQGSIIKKTIRPRVNAA